MNRKRETYDRITVGERIRRRRIQIGLSQDELGERIDRAAKYCSDIERGICGMSVQTMLSLADNLDMSLDYIYCYKHELHDTYENKRDNDEKKNDRHSQSLAVCGR